MNSRKKAKLWKKVAKSWCGAAQTWSQENDALQSKNNWLQVALGEARQAQTVAEINRHSYKMILSMTDEDHLHRPEIAPRLTVNTPIDRSVIRSWANKWSYKSHLVSIKVRVGLCKQEDMHITRTFVSDEFEVTEIVDTLLNELAYALSQKIIG